jgi:hypothetical protein
MAMNPMQRKIRNSFLFGFLIAIIVGALIVGILIMRVKKLNDEIVDKQKVAVTDVYTLNKDVKKDQKLAGDENGNGSVISTVSVPSQLVPENAITAANIDELFGVGEGPDYYEMIAKCDMSQNTLLTTDLVEKSDEMGSYRVVEYSMITLPTKLAEGDYIDIRIKFPTGESLIVLSKIKVDSTTASTMWLTLSEGQYLLVNNAIIESYIVDGCEVYATQYANAAQPALNQTYVPNQNIRAFIEKNGLSETDKEITEMTDKETRDVIEALLGRYRLEEQIDKVKEGFTAEKTAIQAAREALLGEIGY